jgi:hypothetical protein
MGAETVSALDVLKQARAVGVDIGIAGDDLVLEAACQPPDEIIAALSSHKAEIVALLRTSSDGWKVEDWQAFYKERAGIAEFDGGVSRRDAEPRAYECCIVEWLNRHPEPSDPGHCAWCGQQDLSGHTVVPFGVDGRRHAWLHPECWGQWHQDRREKAQAVLSAMGITSGEGGT